MDDSPRMESYIKKCKSRDAKWEARVSEIWGQTSGFPFVVEPKEGELLFPDKKQTHYVLRAKAKLLGVIEARRNDYVWNWPWATNALRAMRGENRLNRETMEEFIEDNPDFEKLGKFVNVKGGKFVFRSGVIDIRLKATLMAATRAGVIYSGSVSPTYTAVFGLSEVHKIHEEMDEEEATTTVLSTRSPRLEKKKSVRITEPNDDSDSVGGEEIS